MNIPSFQRFLNHTYFSSVLTAESDFFKDFAGAPLRFISARSNQPSRPVWKQDINPLRPTHTLQTNWEEDTSASFRLDTVAHVWKNTPDELYPAPYILHFHTRVQAHVVQSTQDGTVVIQLKCEAPSTGSAYSLELPNPPPTIAGKYGFDIRLVSSTSLDMCNILLEVLSIPPHVYQMYTHSTFIPLRITLDSQNLVVVLQSTEEEPLSGRSWLGIRQYVPQHPQKWLYSCFVWHEPFQNHIFSRLDNPTGSTIRIPNITELLPPSVCEIVIHTETDIPVHTVRFHSRQSFRVVGSPPPFGLTDSTALDYSRQHPLRVRCLPLDYVQFQIHVSVYAPYSPKDYIEVRHPDTHTVVLWSFINHAPNDYHTYDPTSHAERTHLSIPVYTGVNVQGQPYGITPGPYLVNHVDRGGVVRNSVEVYIGTYVDT
jgi:hypothetical protein